MIRKAGDTLNCTIFLLVMGRTSFIMFVLVVSSLFQATMQSGELVMTLGSFENSDNKDYNGELCDDGYWGRFKYCDPYFIFCVTDFGNPTSAANCPLLKLQTDSWTDTGNVDFKSRQLRVNFRKWKGYVGLHIIAMDKDIAGNSDDLIDKFTTTIALTPSVNGTFSLQTQLVLHGKQSTFKLSVKVKCQTYFFGADCGRYCRARDNDLEGHYSCNTSGEKVCHSNWYGLSCRQYCFAQNGTNGHYECSQLDGSKICHVNWYGPGCKTYCLAQNGTNGYYQCNSTDGRKICHKTWYGLNCTINCIPRNDASGHYSCDRANGKKICLDGWFSTNCTVYCRERNGSLGHYKCDSVTGGKICLPGWYDENCTTYCVARNDSFGAYKCDERNGARICGNGWFGTYCSKYCIPRNDTQGHYKCDDNSGSKICNENWYGGSCNRYCFSRNDSLGHYWCNSTSGRKICYSGWYGENCQVYCLPKNDSRGHYSCDATTGERKCLLGWFGSECDVYCAEKSNPDEHFSCHNETGEKVCERGWYGHSCNTFCTARNDSRGHYDCNETNGSKICLKGWYGRNCTLQGSLMVSTQHALKTSTSFSVETQMSLQSSANWSIGDTEVQGLSQSLLSLKTSVKIPISTKLQLSVWQITSSVLHEQSLNSVLLPTVSSASSVLPSETESRNTFFPLHPASETESRNTFFSLHPASETESRNTFFPLHPASETEYAIDSSTSLTYPHRFTTAGSKMTIMYLSDSSVRPTISTQSAEISKTQETFYLTTLPETTSSSLNKVPLAETSLQSSAITPSLSVTLTYLQTTFKLESDTVLKTLAISKNTPPFPITSLPKNSWKTILPTSKPSLTSSIWLEATKTVEGSATKPQPKSLFETPAVSAPAESLSAVSASLMISISTMSSVIMPTTYSVLGTPSQTSIYTMASKGLPPTTVSILENGKVGAQGGGTWLLRTAAGKATLSIVICALGIAAMVIALYSYNKRKQKKQQDCKDIKWEGYLDTLAAVGSQNGIQNQAIEVENYTFRQNPMYGLDNDAGDCSAGRKWDNPLFFDVELNNGESGV